MTKISKEQALTILHSMISNFDNQDQDPEVQAILSTLKYACHIINDYHKLIDFEKSIMEQFGKEFQ